MSCRSGCTSASSSDGAAAAAARATVDGRSPASTSGPRPRSTARSTACCSSRTLPGHSWARSRSTAAGVNPPTVRPAAAAAQRVRKCWARSGMSLGRSRRAGISIVITLIRQKRSWAKPPLGHEAAEGLHGWRGSPGHRRGGYRRRRRTRTRSLAAPARASPAWPAMPWRSRRGRSCRDGRGGIFLRDRPLAPVKAAGDVAEQFAFEERFVEAAAGHLDEPCASRRGWRRGWLAASSDLPVPLSPVMRTVAGVSAIRVAMSSAWRIAGWLPRTLPAGASADRRAGGGRGGLDRRQQVGITNGERRWHRRQRPTPLKPQHRPAR